MRPFSVMPVKWVTNNRACESKATIICMKNAK
jgi:hypothetical protein